MFDSGEDHGFDFPIVAPWAWSTTALRCGVSVPTEQRECALDAVRTLADWFDPEVEIKQAGILRVLHHKGLDALGFIDRSVAPLRSVLEVDSIALGNEKAALVREGCALVIGALAETHKRNGFIRPENEGWEFEVVEVLAELHDAIVRATNGPIRPSRDGGYKIYMTGPDRSLIRNLIADTTAAIERDDESVLRLFPLAFGDEREDQRPDRPEEPGTNRPSEQDRERVAELNAGWNALAGSELRDRKSTALSELELLIEQGRCTGDQLHLILRAVNDLRLRLGTQLGIETDEDSLSLREQLSPTHIKFQRLGWLLSNVIEVLSAD